MASTYIGPTLFIMNVRAQITLVHNFFVLILLTWLSSRFDTNTYHLDNRLFLFLET